MFSPSHIQHFMGSFLVLFLDDFIRSGSFCVCFPGLYDCELFLKKGGLILSSSDPYFLCARHPNPLGKIIFLCSTCKYTFLFLWSLLMSWVHHNLAYHYRNKLSHSKTFEFNLLILYETNII